MQHGSHVLAAILCAHTSAASTCRWDTLCCLLVLYVALTLPVQVAFANSRSLSWLRGIDLAIDVLFIIDVYINFRTGALGASRSDTRIPNAGAMPPACDVGPRSHRSVSVGLVAQCVRMPRWQAPVCSHSLSGCDGQSFNTRLTQGTLRWTRRAACGASS